MCDSGNRLQKFVPQPMLSKNQSINHSNSTCLTKIDVNTIQHRVYDGSFENTINHIHVDRKVKLMFILKTWLFVRISSAKYDRHVTSLVEDKLRFLQIQIIFVATNLYLFVENLEYE